MGNSQGKPVIFTDEVNLNHFRLLRVVGKGAFGKVRIVERKDSGLTFALKYIRKDEVVRSESVRNIIRERRMLEQLNHPFLCNLRYSFQDIEYLYIVVDLMNGGDLRFHISRKTFTEEAIRFWVAELGCALRYIHKQGIVHRDLKPDNVLLDSEGHVHLADFNVASEIRPGKMLQSKSGTLAYLAPEVYAGNGYTSGVDWWSLGVTFYECIYSKRPFEGRNHEVLGERIREAKPKYHVTSPPVTMPCLHAMQSLLDKNPSTRIGSAGFETFTSHPFFQVLDFEALERKEIPPIFRPSSEKTNFDATYDLEELLLEEAPLEARARKQKPRAELKEDATEKEIREDELHRMIENMFEPFDYTLANFDKTGVPEDVECLQPGEATTTNTTQPRSSNISPSGSPPLQADVPPAGANKRVGEYFPPLEETTTPMNANPNAPPIEQNSPTPSYSRPIQPQRVRGAMRKSSRGGGVQMTLDEHGSWAELANQSSTVPGEGFETLKGRERGAAGMLGFLNRKKGRDRSPKPQEPGVLGKEGARHIIN